MQKPSAILAVRAASASLLILFGACHKRPSGPSPHYDKGAAIHQELYVHELDDAYLDPRMDEAVSELKQVEPDSVSAHLAEDLLAQIEQGRKAAQAARDAEAKALAASQRPQTIDPSKVLRADAVSPGAAPAEADGGGAPIDPYGPGAPIADINRESGGCLVAGTAFREEGSGKSGATYRLADGAACKGKLPGFVGQTVLAVDGRIYRRVSSSEVKAEPGLPGAPALLPDGGAPPATPAATALAAPQGAPPPPARADVASAADTVAAEQNATPPPPPAPGSPRPANPSGSAATNVAQDQDATPSAAPSAPTPAVPMEDATPPPAP